MTKQYGSKTVALVCQAILCWITVGCGTSPDPSNDDKQDTADSGTPTERVTVLGDKVEESSPVFNETPQIADSIVIGLDADMTSAAAQSGEAIRRGALLAIDEINDAGGLLGRPVELVIRDHRGNPERGVDNIADFAAMKNMLAVVGGTSHARCPPRACIDPQTRVDLPGALGGGNTCRRQRLRSQLCVSRFCS